MSNEVNLGGNLFLNFINRIYKILLLFFKGAKNSIYFLKLNSASYIIN